MLVFLLYFDNHLRCVSSQAKTKGCQSRVDIGVKYAARHERMFDDEKLKAGQAVIGLQVPFVFCFVCF